MVAFHFPPFGGSSGSRRTVAFSRYLPRSGWEPLVLTADLRAYDQVKLEELRDVPDGMTVVRAFGIDTARHFSIGGRHPAWLAVPDRWRFWQPFAVRAGMRMIREHAPAVIWSTYPIASSHMIGAKLHARTAIPWVADMRDPMVEVDPSTGEQYPRDPRVRQARLRIEQNVASRAAHVVFCTEGAREIFVHRFGEAVRSKTSVIANGYDEEVFRDAEQSLSSARQAESGGFRLIHSGTVYPGDDRGPAVLFRALAVLRASGELPNGFRLILRATGYDDEMRQLIEACGVQEIVELAPALPYRPALQEMLTADGLLLLQGSASNPAVPAKLYEYLRAQRPILALVHHQGETAALLARLKAAIVAPLDEVEPIVGALRDLFTGWKNGTLPMANRETVATLSRAEQARELARLLTRVVPKGDASEVPARAR
jgi:glycosyltransferase involved in cell wall biosynthesis